MNHVCSCGERPGDIVELLTHECDGRLTVGGLSRRERSTLMYVESCVVDHGGELDGERMNHDDFNAIKVFTAAGLLSVTEHQVTRFAADAWDLARDCRRERSTLGDDD